MPVEEMPTGSFTVTLGIPHKAPALPALGQLSRMFPLCLPLHLHLTTSANSSGSRRKVAGDGAAESRGREGPRGPCQPLSGQQHTLPLNRV